MGFAIGIGISPTLGQGGGWRGSPSTVIWIGDSQTAQAFGVGTFPGHGIAVSANALMGWPMTLINGGVSGDGTQDVLARLDALLAAYPTAGTAVILIGTNNPGKGINAANTIIDNDEICRRCRAVGVRPVVLTLTPRTDQASGGLLTFIQAVNAGILASTLPFAVADTFTALADPGNSLLPYANALFDSVHPAIKGAVLAARDAVVAKLTPIVGTIGTLTSSDTDYREYAANPMAAGDNADTVNGWRLGTGITGTGPNGWSAEKRSTGVGVASKSGGAARMVATFSANWDGAGFQVGGDDLLATGRYDQAWAAGAAQAIGSRRRPTSPNGYHYRAIVGGTTAGSQPTWPTTEGATIVDGTVTWMCQRTPTSGDKFVATADLQFSGLVSGKWIVPRLSLNAINTSSATYSEAVSNYADLSSVVDFGAEYAPPSMRLVTPEMTLGSDTMRYLKIGVEVFGQAAGGVTMDVLRASIRRTSP